jgi:hypothetical protein
MELKDTEVHIGAPSLSLTRFINIDDEKTHEYSLCWEMEPCGWLRRWLIENDLLDACVIRYFDRLPLVGGKKKYMSSEIIEFQRSRDAILFKLACLNRISIECE